METFIQTLIILSTAWIAIAFLVPFLASNKKGKSTTTSLTTSEKWSSREYRVKRLREKKELDKTWPEATVSTIPTTPTYEDVITKAVDKGDVAKTSSLIRAKAYYQLNPKKLDEVIVELYTI